MTGAVTLCGAYMSGRLLTCVNSQYFCFQNIGWLGTQCKVQMTGSLAMLSLHLVAGKQCEQPVEIMLLLPCMQKAVALLAP